MKRIALITLLLIIATILGERAWFELVDEGKLKVLVSLKNIEPHHEYVVLERFYYDRQALQSIAVPRSHFDLWLDRLQPRRGGLRKTYSKCWVPHHRVRFDPLSDDAEFEICFTCNEFWTRDSGRRKIPKEWCLPMRELLRSSGISDEAPSREEYEAHMESLFDRAQQDGTDQPATRSESKSEGDDKPQPDAEGRSR